MSHCLITVHKGKFLYSFLQKITITDLALLLQHLLTCKDNCYWSEFFKAGRAKCYMKLVREIEPDIEHVINHY